MFDQLVRDEQDTRVSAFWEAVNQYLEISKELKKIRSSNRSNIITSELHTAELREKEQYRHVIECAKSIGFDETAVYAAITLQKIHGRKPNLEEILNARQEIVEKPFEQPFVQQIEWLKEKLGAKNIIEACLKLEKVDRQNLELLENNYLLQEVMRNLEKAQISIAGTTILDLFANKPALQQLTKNGAKRVIHIDSNPRFKSLHQALGGYANDYHIIDLLNTTALEILHEIHETAVDGIFILRPPLDDVDSLKTFFNLAKSLLRKGGFLYMKFDWNGLRSLDNIPDGQKPYCIYTDGLVRIFRYYTIPPTYVKEDLIGNKELVYTSNPY